MARRSRQAQLGEFTQVQAKLEAGRSERALSQELQIPRSTVQRWRRAQLPTEVPLGLAQFLESEEGLEWLHRQVVAAHLVITLLAGAGIRLVCEFLQLSGLAPFVASSYGSQHKINVALQEAVRAYAEQQRLTLGQAMPEREITVCEDETYHPEICLVGLEPVSNFILLERYAQDRSAATWTQALEEALKDLPVTVIQGTSDEAKGLLRQVEKDLGAHHSPDLFHVQHEVSKATALAMARRVEQARRQRDEAAHLLEQHRQTRSDFEAQTPRPPGRPPAFEPRIVTALLEHKEAEAHCRQAEEQQQQAREIVRTLGEAYHPYDLPTAEAQPVEQVAERFQACWEQLTALAEQADLPSRARERIAKAQRMTASLLATLTFFFTTIQAKVEALALAPEIEAAVHQQLIPAIYLERVADRSSRADERHTLRQLSARLLEPLREADSVFATLENTTREEIERVAGECADLFQRSSSCVEGRNGQLALHHHGTHRLSEGKLCALTAMHNYFIRRSDGTTAAERFFGQPPPPMFKFLLTHLKPPPRPARKRPRPQRAPYLAQAAA